MIYRRKKSSRLVLVMIDDTEFFGDGRDYVKHVWGNSVSHSLAGEWNARVGVVWERMAV